MLFPISVTILYGTSLIVTMKISTVGADALVPSTRASVATVLSTNLFPAFPAVHELNRRPTISHIYIYIYIYIYLYPSRDLNSELLR